MEEGDDSCKITIIEKIDLLSISRQKTDNLPKLMFIDRFWFIGWNSLISKIFTQISVWEAITTLHSTGVFCAVFFGDNESSLCL